MDDIIQREFRIVGGRTRNLPWFMRAGTRNDLARLFGRVGFTEGVEVGTNRGQYAEILCRENPGLHLTCVDPWEAYSDGESNPNQGRQDAIYAHTVGVLSSLNVTIRRGTSLGSVDHFEDGSLDFVYIDGNHMFDYVAQDIIRWAQKVRMGGVVCCHDYHSQGGNDVRLAVDAYTRAHDIRPWYVTREEWPTAFWVRKI
jgi:hypothetical protein